MADYFNCGNNHISAEQVIRSMIYEDAEGNPVLHTNPGGTNLEPYFNCDKRQNLSLEQVLKDMVLVDVDGKPYLNTTSL